MTQPISREDCQRGAAKSLDVRRAKRDEKIAGLDALAAYQRGYHDGYQAGWRPAKKAAVKTTCDDCGRVTFGAGPCFYCRQAAKFGDAE